MSKDPIILNGNAEVGGWARGHATKVPSLNQTGDVAVIWYVS